MNRFVVPLLRDVDPPVNAPPHYTPRGKDEALTYAQYGYFIWLNCDAGMEELEKKG